MSKASQFLDDLYTRPPSQQEMMERQDAARPHTNLVATTDGRAIQLAPTPDQAPLEWKKPESTTD